MEYKLSILLKSETIIGSGNSLPGSVDNDLVYSDSGLPIIKGRTIKGNLRESFELLLSLTDKNSEMTDLFFGKAGIYNYEEGILRISDATFSDDILIALEEAIYSNAIFPEELKNALTNDRDFTQIENGVTKDGSLRRIRTLNSGIRFWSHLNFKRELTPKETAYLTGALCLTKHIGLMRNRGKGEVECSLWLGDEDITFKSLNELERSLTNDGISNS